MTASPGGHGQWRRGFGSLVMAVVRVTGGVSERNMRIGELRAIPYELLMTTQPAGAGRNCDRTSRSRGYRADYRNRKSVARDHQ